MMTSSNGKIFRVITGSLCREFTGRGEFTTQRPVTQSFDVFFDNGWVNNREAGDLRRYRGHYDVHVMKRWSFKYIQNPINFPGIFMLFVSWFHIFFLCVKSTAQERKYIYRYILS